MGGILCTGHFGITSFQNLLKSSQWSKSQKDWREASQNHHTNRDALVILKERYNLNLFLINRSPFVEDCNLDRLTRNLSQRE